MQIDPLNLSHQNLLESKFHQLNPLLTEYSFANLYLFRKLHRYEVIKYQEEVFIKGVTRDRVAFIMLTSPPTHFSSVLLLEFFALAQAEILFPIPEGWLLPLEPFLLQASFKEADSDYLFATFRLAHYPGRHLSKKRNLVTQLINSHEEVRAEDLSEQLADAQQILDNWQKEHVESWQETDYTACQEAIQNLKALHLHGRIIYVDQQAAGFTIGEWISKDCYSIHFCKASRSIKGLYQYLYQDLAQSVEGTCSWINLEQDLGLPTIHHAKHSYLPDQILRKWRVKLK